MNKNVNLMKLSPPYVHGQVGGCKSTPGVKKKRHVLRVSFPNVEGKFTEINDFIHGEVMLELSL